MQKKRENENDNDIDLSPQPPTKRRLVVSPWSNVQEFRHVIDAIYGANANAISQKQALSQIETWIIHRRAQCPAAVYATKTLLEVNLKDNESKYSNEDLQSMYAFALVRFFNYMSSTLQTYNMRTMYQTAIGLGLPSFVVDIRHVCAHGTSLPELSLLRRTTAFCLDWLKQYYWQEQAKTMEDADHLALIEINKAKSKLVKSAELLFQVYDAAFLCHLKGATKLKDCKRIISARRYEKLKTFHSNEKSFRETLDQALNEMFELTKNDLTKKDLAETFVSEMLRMQSFYKITEYIENEECLEMLIDAAQGIFRLAFVCGIIQKYFLGLLQHLEGSIENEERCKGANFWACQLAIALNAYQKCKVTHANNPTFIEVPWHKIDHGKLNLDKTKHKEERQLYVFSGYNTKTTLIIGDYFTRPWIFSFSKQFLMTRLENINKYTAPVLKRIYPLIQPKLCDDDIDKLNAIIDIYVSDSTTLDNLTGQTKEKRKEEEAVDKIYTVEDLLEKVNEVQINGNIYGNWKLVKDNTFDWSKCPVGRLPWQ